MTILPKPPKMTPAEQRASDADAYETATLRDHHTCQRCRRNCGPFNRDHRKNRSQGGQTVASNLQGLGGTGTTGCHGWKTLHPKEALEQGWAVPSWGDPAEWPAARWFPTDHGTHRLGWALYDDAGNVTEITEAEAMQRMEGAGW